MFSSYFLMSFSFQRFQSKEGSILKRTLLVHSPNSRRHSKSTYLIFQLLQLQAFHLLPLGPIVPLPRRDRGRRPPLNVTLRVPCDSDAEVVSVFLSYEPDQVYRMSQSALCRLPTAET